MINTFSSGEMLICPMKDLQHNQNDSRICKRDESAKRQIVKINDICYLSNSVISGNSFEQISIIGIKCIRSSSQAFILDYSICVVVLSLLRLCESVKNSKMSIIHRGSQITYYRIIF